MKSKVILVIQGLIIMAAIFYFTNYPGRKFEESHEEKSIKQDTDMMDKIEKAIYNKLKADGKRLK